MARVLRGARPDRPPSGFTDQLWKLSTATWLEERGSEPQRRPSTSTILDRLNKEVDNWGRSIVPSAAVENNSRVCYRPMDECGCFFCDVEPGAYLMGQLTAISRIVFRPLFTQLFPHVTLTQVLPTDPVLPGLWGVSRNFLGLSI